MMPYDLVEPASSCTPRPRPVPELATTGGHPVVADHQREPAGISVGAFAASVERTAPGPVFEHRPSRIDLVTVSRRAGERSSASFVWAFAPLFTLGLAAVPCFVYAAHRLRTRALYVAVIAYSALTLLVVWGASTDSESNLQSEIGGFTTMVLVTVATAHTLVVRRSVFSENGGVDPAIAAARARLRRRQEARRIAAEDPALARELKIGRPDQPRAYDDGGLIDVNHVPVGVLSGVEGISLELASTIVDARELLRRFDSRDDLEVALGLDPYSLESTPDLLVFLH